VQGSQGLFDLEQKDHSLDLPPMMAMDMMADIAAVIGARFG